MSTSRRTPVVSLILVAWLLVHAGALLLAGRATAEGAPWWAWGIVPDDVLRRLGADVPALVRLGDLRRVLTYGFLHHLVLNLALNAWILWGTGRRLEASVGSARFWIVFVTGLAGGGAAHAGLGTGILVGGWCAILGVLGATLLWSYLAPDPAARAARGSALLFLAIVAALSLAFGGSVVADVGGLLGGAVAMLLLGPRRSALPAGSAVRRTAWVLAVLLLLAGALQTLDAGDDVDASEARTFLHALGETEVVARALYRQPRAATPARREDLARRLAALRDPPVLHGDVEAREALHAYLDVWLRVARGDVPDPFAFEADLAAAEAAWRAHERALRARSGIPRTWQGGTAPERSRRVRPRSCPSTARA